MSTVVTLHSQCSLDLLHEADSEHLDTSSQESLSATTSGCSAMLPEFGLPTLVGCNLISANSTGPIDAPQAPAFVGTTLVRRLPIGHNYRPNGAAPA